MSHAKTKNADKALVGLAGEYHVLAQLAERGYVGALTLGHTKGVDILVTNPRSGTVRTVEVKTTRTKLGRHRVFSVDHRFYAWPMSRKHETVTDPGLVYCFVALGTPGASPNFFLVPAPEVAAYVTWQRRHWLDATGGRDSDVQVFRIEEHDPKSYRDNWALFE